MVDEIAQQLSATRVGTPQPLLTESTTAPQKNDSLIFKMDAVIQEYKDVFTKYSRNYSNQALANEDLQKAASEEILQGKKVSPEVQVKITQYIGECMSEESQNALRRIKEHLEKENETLAWRLMQPLRRLLPGNPLHRREQRALDDVRLEDFLICAFALVVMYAVASLTINPIYEWDFINH